MTSVNIATETLCTNISDLLCLSIVHDGQLLNEIDILREMQTSVISPIERYYFCQESLLCDVPEAIHDILHDYGLTRNQTIESLSDYDALHMTNFTKNQLHCIYCCFNFRNEQINIRCSEGHDYWCL